MVTTSKQGKKPYASRNNNGNDKRTSSQIMMPHQMVESRDGERSKNGTLPENHHHFQAATKS